MKSKYVVSFLLSCTIIMYTLVYAPVEVMGASALSNYPMPSIYSASSVFSLKADNTTIPVISYVDEYDYANFSFSGTVTLKVTVNEPITSYSISPLAKNIQGSVSGNTLTFNLSESTYVIVEINGLKRLVVAADPMETNVPASSGAGIYNVTSSKYNADPLGNGMATGALQSAIDDAHNAGGGTVYVPAGVYKCANLYLKSNVTLYLAGGSVIVGTGNGADYVTDFNKSSLGKDGTFFIRTTTGSHDITIRGRGTIDGRGMDMRLNTNFLNNLLVPMQTSNFTLEGITLRDGGFWAFMPVRSDNVVIKNYKGYQQFGYLEADALDINECQNVVIEHSIAIADDDTFSTKTWWQYGMSADWPGSVEPIDSVTFDDCLAWSNCVAFKLGQGTGALQKNVIFKNSYVYECSRALVVDHSYQEGPVQNITFYNMDIEKVNHTKFGNYWARVSSSSPGAVSNVTFQNINIRMLGGQQSILRGYSDVGSVDGIVFSNINVKGNIASTLSDMKISVGNYVSNVRVVPSTDILMHDHFESGNLNAWTSVSGDWDTITDGTGVLSQHALSSAIITRGGDWGNYAYEADVKLSYANANAGLLFRVQDANNYYMYRINGSTNKVELYKCINGAMTKVSETSYTPQANVWTMLSIKVYNNHVKGYINGRLMTEWTNNTSELTSGKIGFRTTSQGVVFDDVLVSDY